MKFSIVIPMFNKENHIARAIRSVLNQTHKDFELIIVDDGSTDNSINRINKFKDSRIKVVQQKNSGVSSARNKGIEIANSTFIGFLDADDTWKPNFLETIKLLIEKYPFAGAYATAYEMKITSTKTIISKNFLSIKTGWRGIIDDYFKHSFETPLISASSVVIPRHIFDQIGFFPVGIKRGEDQNMWSRIALQYDIAFVNDICASYYRNINDSLTKSNSILSESSANFAEEFLIKNRSKKNYSIYFEEYMIKSIIIKARYYVDMNKRKEARRLLKGYRNTKYNKQAYIRAYLFSWLPRTFIHTALNIKKQMKNFLNYKIFN